MGPGEEAGVGKCGIGCFCVEMRVFWGYMLLEGPFEMPGFLFSRWSLYAVHGGRWEGGDREGRGLAGARLGGGEAGLLVRGKDVEGRWFRGCRQSRTGGERGDEDMVD